METAKSDTYFIAERMKRYIDDHLQEPIIESLRALQATLRITQR
jgi:hypothetical protein